MTARDTIEQVLFAIGGVEKTVEAAAIEALGWNDFPSIIAAARYGASDQRTNQRWKDATGAARAALTAASPHMAVPAGWVLVPEEPLPEMIGAWYRVKNGHHFHDEPAPTDTSDYAAYRAMLSSRPKGGA